MPESALTLHFTQRFGAVDRIMSLLRRRGFPISGMTVERTHQPDVGRMTVLVQQPGAVEQVSRHLRKLPDVLTVHTAAADEAIHREYALARIRCATDDWGTLMEVLARHDARPVCTEGDCLVVEAAGDSAHLDALFAALESFCLEESARTSSLALRRGTQEPVNEEETL